MKSESKQVRVSIVLPTYNRGPMLPQAIESCLSQSFKNLEVIVIDDGSTDGTSGILFHLSQKDSRLRYYRQKHLGLPTALNYGFKQARGSLWSWTSDDNRYHTDAIERMVQYLDLNPDVGMVYTGYNWVDENGRILKVFRNRSPSDLPQENVVGPCFLYKKSIADVVGPYDPERYLVEDWDYWLRIYAITQIHSLDEVHYDFTDHDSSLTQQHTTPILEATYWMRLNTPCAEARNRETLQHIARRLSTKHWSKKHYFTAYLWRLRSRGWNI